VNLNFRDGATLHADDLPAVLRVVHRSFPGSNQEVFTLTPLCRYGKVTVSYLGDTPVCVLQAMRNWHDQSQMQFVSVSTDPDYWGQGVLSTTLSHLLSTLPHDGIRTIGVRITFDNKAMWRVFVEKAGFTLLHEARGCFGRGEDRLYLEKSLV
jgi:GNAT superfamily N-acetyltransferase